MGRTYLDCVNNVAHVGHERREVVEAGQLQMGVLNTNTRYLHRNVLDYAHRLAALFPDPLSVCFFVNSGSEANELALRMARAHTGGYGVVSLEGGYHGHSQNLIDVSHYKHAGSGGAGAPEWVRTAPIPDDYRGVYGREVMDRGTRYAMHVGEAFGSLSSNGHEPAAFIAESILSCGGQIEPPAGYLEEAYRIARSRGAVCIADEVQIGFGRVGSHMWGFETANVVPDIVTLGKPIGNGHPIGAVVTTLEIAESFANGMEFFSTFGGNPVSAAIGLAVLDVIEGDKLQEHAAVVGGHLEGEPGVPGHAPRKRGRCTWTGALPRNRVRRRPNGEDPECADRGVCRESSGRTGRPPQHGWPGSQCHQDQATDDLRSAGCRAGGRNPGSHPDGGRGTTQHLGPSRHAIGLTDSRRILTSLSNDHSGSEVPCAFAAASTN